MTRKRQKSGLVVRDVSSLGGARAIVRRAQELRLQRLKELEAEEQRIKEEIRRDNMTPLERDSEDSRKAHEARMANIRRLYWEGDSDD